MNRKQIKQKFLTRAGRRLQEIYQFGYPIHLTYKGNQDFKTRNGWSVGLLILIISLLYAGARFFNMITRKNPNISRYQIVRGYDSREEILRYILKLLFLRGASRLYK